MKVRNFLTALMIVGPVVVWTQAPPALQTQLTSMKTNTAKVSNPAERERWQANVALWETMINRTGTLEIVDLAKMRAPFDTMKANVAKITDSAEKERWQANCDMWAVLMAQPGKIAKDGRDKMRAGLEVIKTNAAKIRVPAERERWDSNRELWTLTLRVM